MIAATDAIKRTEDPNRAVGARKRMSLGRIETILTYGVVGDIKIGGVSQIRIAEGKASTTNTRCTHLGRLQSISLADFLNKSVPRVLRPVRRSSGHADTCVD